MAKKAWRKLKRKFSWIFNIKRGFTFDEDDEVISSFLTKSAFDSDFKKRL